jgi:hypothetical protein
MAAVDGALFSCASSGIVMNINSCAERRLRVAGVVAMVMLFASEQSLSAQWIRIALPDTPRTADGKPNLAASTPKADDGKPDLSGIWRSLRGVNSPPANSTDLPGRIDYYMPKGAEIPLRPEAAALYQQRSTNLGKGRPSERCLPHGIPDAMLYGGPMKIVQNRRLTIILFEEFNHYRQLFSDGRAFPKDPQPTWFGYSVGRWEGDTFVVDSMGFNDQTWMDDSGLPHTDALRTTERFRRRDFGHLDLQLTIDDAKAYTRRWTVDIGFVLLPDTELIESICENEKYASRVGK